MKTSTTATAGGDARLADARGEDFDALVLPGGLLNPDTLRSTPEAVEFVRAFADAGKPIGTICHAPWVLIEAGLVRGRTLTSWPAIQTDVKNAGGNWVDQEVVMDGNLVASRKPDDVLAFSAKLIVRSLPRTLPRPAARAVPGVPE